MPYNVFGLSVVCCEVAKTHYIRMKRSVFMGLLALSTTLTFVTGCGEKAKKPLSEKIAKNWSAQKVEHGSTLVYTKGAASGNTSPGYATFSLNLSSPPAVTFKDIDGNTFTGQYELQGETKLILKNLTPQPTGSNGTIEFTINSVSDAELVLTRLTASPKTGGTINKYYLANP